MINKEQVDKIINSDVPSRHSFFQLNFFIIGKEPTHQAKLRRCVDELRVRKRSLDAMNLELDELDDKKLLLDFEDRYEGAEKEIRTRMVARKRATIDQAIEDVLDKIKNCEEEMLFLTEAFNKLSEISPIKSWDDLEVQTEYWNAKLSEEINHKLLMKMPIDIETVKLALAMPPNAPIRNQLISLLKVQGEKLLEGNG
jgi:hypothetical protein